MVAPPRPGYFVCGFPLTEQNRGDGFDESDAGHADHSWALALALAAADSPAPSVEFVSSGARRPSSQAAGF